MTRKAKDQLLLCEMSDDDLRAWAIAIQHARFHHPEKFDVGDARLQAHDVDAEILRRGLTVVYDHPAKPR
jgi:hypothetical protein